MNVSTMPPPVLHQRLVNEATRLGTEAILQRLPAEYSRDLELAIQQGIRQAVLHYADRMDTLSRQLRPLAHGQKTGA